ncbi:type IX secretion system membrane protein PorP/SprF [Aggregatimonas sangjinii]|uniref:Type IX secretion system membrane protein PorP/SprF n=1 Tax=Aggregatimonas sangjinii TaxID=2583587 RepID=A0A5B7SN96_9FLAO|nr:type IX secretion system membrane protein PorP/SprF [Aggregatimonas sangjinii]QCX00125.1 type IX secretion system membrane protein PorP/SprF [Aggregatimonas sangjinii]
MAYKSNIYRTSLLLVLCALCNLQVALGQEAAPNPGPESTYHNQLFFNRFFINPTFSVVRENKSYLNILHRNQYSTFEDNRQNYFLGFSNQLNERTALGIGVYSQWAGVVQEFGFNANYATALTLGSNSKLTVGANLNYFNVGLDKNRIVIAESDDTINEARKESKIGLQPGATLSIGNFDFGLYAQDLIQYNQTTNMMLTNLSVQNVKASLQYTYTFNATRGVFENARLMPLLQFGQDENKDLDYSGSLLFDMPNYGWFQTNFDPTYGMSFGLGVNISKKMSLGYLLEKDILQDDTNLGWNHEVSLAYTFDKKQGDDDWANVSEDQRIDEIIRNYEEQILQLTADANRAPLDKKEVNEVIIDQLAYENRLILDQLILRQDSIENARNAAMEKRYEMIVRAVTMNVKNSINAELQGNGTSSYSALAQTEKPKVEYKNLKNSIKTELTGKGQNGYGTLAQTENTSVQKREDRYKDFKEIPTKVLNGSDIIGVGSGYYMIANVYKSKKYKDAFMKDLKEKGLDPKEFYNKENGLHYVYLADYNYKGDAKTDYVTNLNGKYQDEKWIMEVADNSAIVHNYYPD